MGKEIKLKKSKIAFFFFLMKRFVGTDVNQRIFLELVARKFNIAHPRDWAAVTNKQFADEGGQLILRRHNNSMFKVLSSLCSGKQSSFLIL